MSPLQVVYGLLAILGLAVPWYFNVQFMSGGESLLDLGAFLGAAFVNPASASLTVDLLVAFGAFVVWLFPEARRIGMRHSWIYAVLGFAVAFAFAFPLFLLMRDRHLQGA